MPISWQRRSRIELALVHYRDKMLAHMPVEFTEKDFLDELVPNKLREYVRKGPLIFQVLSQPTSYTNMTVPIGDVSYTFTFTSCINSRGNVLLMPNGPYLEWSEDKPSCQRLAAWAGDVANLRMEFGIVKATLDHLMEHCASAANIRYFMPTVMLLLEHNVPQEDEKERAFIDSLRQPKVPTTFPPLPTWVREGCKQAAQTLAMVSLIPEKEGDGKPRTFHVGVTMSIARDFHGVSMKSF